MIGFDLIILVLRSPFLFVAHKASLNTSTADRVPPAWLAKDQAYFSLVR